MVVVKKLPPIELPVNSVPQVNTLTVANANSAPSIPSPLKLVLVNVFLVVPELKRMQHKLVVKTANLVFIPVTMDLAWNAPLVLSVPLQEHQFVANAVVEDNPFPTELTVSCVLRVNSPSNLALVNSAKRTNIPLLLVLVFALLVVLVLKLPLTTPLVNLVLPVISLLMRVLVNNVLQAKLPLSPDLLLVLTVNVVPNPIAIILRVCCANLAITLMMVNVNSAL